MAELKKPSRDFKGIWIPKNIWISDKMSIIEKIFFVEIDSLDNKDGCFASNSYFAKFFKMTNGRVSQIINSLIKKGYLQAVYEREGKQIIKRVLRILNTPYLENDNTPSKNTKYPYIENDKDNNTTINNTIDNNKDIIDEIYKSYPSKCIISKRPTGKSKKCKDKIKRLLKAGQKDLPDIIKRYVKECEENKTFMKNFSTFLNNLPDYSDNDQNDIDDNYGMCEAEIKYHKEQRTKNEAS